MRKLCHNVFKNGSKLRPELNFKSPFLKMRFYSQTKLRNKSSDDEGERNVARSANY